MMIFKVLNWMILVFYIFLVVGFLFYALIFTVDSNHSSYDIATGFLYFLAFAVVTSTVVRIFLKDSNAIRVNNFHFIVLALFLCIIVFSDFFNIMIFYEKWVERRMPDKFSITPKGYIY